uniref:Uncharacterized protein n=1 Tax=Romanomermis culicivorax TaxID=13658 RepID=A0A915JTA4_ROMCU
DFYSCCCLCCNTVLRNIPPLYNAIDQLDYHLSLILKNCLRLHFIASISFREIFFEMERSSANDNKSNQCNPNNANYQGHNSHYSGTGTKSDLNNHSNQMNPTHGQYGGGSKGGGSGGGSHGSAAAEVAMEVIVEKAE